MNYKEKDRLKRLKERLEWLEKRYLESNRDLHRDKSEASALRWAIEYIESADQELGGFSISNLANNLGIPADADSSTVMDMHYAMAVDLVVENQRATISLLRRHLYISAPRAETLFKLLENNGVIGPDRGELPREVLVKQKLDLRV